ncbi:MAG: alpha/beta hydrolase fold domain-containing protein [Bacteroidia bacterium]|nr:alpha/beta hydrolase fold domain-containing protein [Bacteroidia bacterium]
MKQLILLILAAIAAPVILAQNPCGQGRYLIEAFEVDTTMNIVYGENIQATITNPTARQTLFFDLYEPAGDTLAARPLIIMAFGGAFVGGTRQDADITTVCARLAKLGYVTASIDYRTTLSLIFDRSERNYYLAILKAIHDMRAAVRFFRADADSANLYRIDPNQIYVGGISAGGVTGIHVAFMDEPTDFPNAILQDTAGIGGIEGLSGNPGFSSEVAGVISLCGAIGDTTWMNDNLTTPLIMSHGTNDQVVPFGSTTALFGENITAHGSQSIQAQADRLGIDSKLLVYQGADHVPFSSGPNAEVFMDNTINFIRDQLALLVCQQSSTAIAPDLNKFKVEVSPLPATTQVTIRISEELAQGYYSLQLISARGELIASTPLSPSGEWTIQRESLPAGIYFYRIVGSQGNILHVGKLLFT